MKKVLLLFSFLISIHTHAQPKPNYRDVIYLKNGSVIKGYYKDFNPSDSIRLETIDGGYFVCAVSDISRIAKENTEIYLIKEHAEEGLRVWRKPGYRGNVEYSFCYSLMNTRFMSSGFTSTHGYQFNPYIFTGVGIGIQSVTIESDGYSISTADAIIPIFADVRCYPLKKRISPYIEGRAGYTFWGIKGLLVTGLLGCDFSISPRFGFLVSLGYIYQGYKNNDNTCSHLNMLTLELGFHF